MEGEVLGLVGPVAHPIDAREPVLQPFMSRAEVPFRRYSGSTRIYVALSETIDPTSPMPAAEMAKAGDQVVLAAEPVRHPPGE